MPKALFLFLALMLGSSAPLTFAAQTKPVASKASQAVSASKPQPAMPHSTQSMPHDMQNMPGMSH